MDQPTQPSASEPVRTTPAREKKPDENPSVPPLYTDLGV